MSLLLINNVVDFAEAVLYAASLPRPDNEFKLILGMFDVNISKGQLHIPEPFSPKIQKWFGKIDDSSEEDAVLRVENQTVGKSRCTYTVYPLIIFLGFKGGRLLEGALKRGGAYSID